LCKQRAALLAPRVASYSLRLLSAALSAPHSHAAAMLCAVARLLAACPRIESLLHPAEGASTSAASLALADPDTAAVMQATAWQLAALQQHYHPVVAELATKLARQEQLPLRYSKATPLRLMTAYSEASGNFNPKPSLPATTQPRKRCVVPTSWLEDVREVAKVAKGGAGRPCLVQFHPL